MHEENPLDANLEKVIPGLHHWHTATHSAVTSLSTRIDDFQGDVKAHIQELKAAVLEGNKKSNQKLAGEFMRIAHSLLAEERGLNDEPEAPSRFELQMEGDSMDGIGDFFAQDDPPAALDMPHDHFDHKSFQMANKHQQLTDLWDEWNGLGRFEDAYGGVHGRDLKYGKKWRRHISSHQHSRHRRVVFGVKVYADRHQLTVQEAIVQLEDKWTQCRGSAANFVTYLQSIGAIEKKKSRGKFKS